MDTALNIIETEITVPAPIKPVTLLHVTDLHLTRADGRDGEYVNSLAVERRAVFPDAERIFDAFIRYIKADPPDFTALTGDIIDFPSRKNLETLSGFLDGVCKNYLYVPGNHDWCYPNQRPDEKTLAGAYPLLYGVTGGAPDFQAVGAGDVTLIGLDDSSHQITRSQLKKLEAELKKGKFCLLFLHVPLYTESLVGNVLKVWKKPLMIGLPPHMLSGDVSPELIPSPETRRFCEIAADRALPVAAVVCGHVHFSHEDFFFDGRGQYITEEANRRGVIRKIRLTGG